MVLEFWLPEVLDFMKGNGKMTWNKEKVMNSFLLDHIMMANMIKISQMVLVNFIGVMVKRMRGNGFKGWSMVKEYGKELKEIHIMENG